jgi:flagellar hook-basal body complex protein FliE
MDPISALRSAIPAFLNRAQGAGASSPISQKELESLANPTGTGTLGKSGSVGGASFGDVLGKMVEEVNTKQMTAGQAVRDLQSGQNVSLHQAMIAMEEASVSFQLMVEVRNKLLESYQELMRMQI